MAFAQVYSWKIIHWDYGNTVLHWGALWTLCPVGRVNPTFGVTDMQGLTSMGAASWKPRVSIEKVRDGSLLYSSLKHVRKLFVKLPNVVVSFEIWMPYLTMLQISIPISKTGRWPAYCHNPQPTSEEDHLGVQLPGESSTGEEVGCSVRTSLKRRNAWCHSCQSHWSNPLVSGNLCNDLGWK